MPPTAAYKYTRHQVPRGTLSDAQDEKAYYLFKNVSTLYATYQISLLAYYAWKRGKKLVIQVPQRCRKGESLARLIKEHASVIRFEKVK